MLSLVFPKFALLRGFCGFAVVDVFGCLQNFDLGKIDEARIPAKVRPVDKLANSYINILLYISNSII